MAGRPAPFQFDDELIEQLAFDIDLDCCGALAECEDETCACYLLGRGGMPIDVFRNRDGRWGVRVNGSIPVVVTPVHDTLAGAVRAAQERLDSLALRNDRL